MVVYLKINWRICLINIVYIIRSESNIIVIKMSLFTLFLILLHHCYIRYLPCLHIWLVTSPPQINLCLSNYYHDQVYCQLLVFQSQIHLQMHHLTSVNLPFSCLSILLVCHILSVPLIVSQLPYFCTSKNNNKKEIGEHNNFCNWTL